MQQATQDEHFRELYGESPEYDAVTPVEALGAFFTPTGTFETG